MRLVWRPPALFELRRGLAVALCAKADGIQVLCALVGALLLATSAYSQPCPEVRARNPDGNYIIPGVQGDIAYATDLALDAYVQRGGSRRPSAIVNHGCALSARTTLACARD